MTVTGLRADARVPGCIVVDADGARFASLPLETVRELGLQVGLTLSVQQQEQVLSASAVEGARRVALRLLAARPRAVGDLKRRLRDRGHEASAIQGAIQRLESTGLLDDAEFARHFVRVRGPRGHGPSRLVSDLLGLGVDRKTAEQAVAEVEEAEGRDVAGMARALAEKRAGQLGMLPQQQKRRRLVAYLSRRGFRGYEVRKMVEDLL